MSRGESRRANDRELSLLVLSLIDEARELFDEVLPQEQFWYVEERRRSFRQYRWISESRVKKLDAARLATVYGYCDGLSVRDRFCGFLASSQPFVQRFKHGAGNHGIAVASPEQTARQVIWRFLELNGSLAPNRSLGRRIANQLSAFYSSEQILCEYVRYVEGIAIGVKSARLGSIVIEPLSEIQHIYNKDSFFRHFYDEIDREKTPTRIKAFARMRLRRREPVKTKEHVSNTSELRSLAEFAWAVDALRIKASRPMGATRVKSMKYIQPFYNVPTFVGTDQIAPRLAYSVLGRADFRAVREISTGLTSARSRFDTIDLVMRRLKYADSRDDIEDRVLDIFISAELILRICCGEEEYTNKEKMALFFAKFLGSDMTTKQEIYRRTKQAYDLRNIVVHGKPKSKQAMKIAHNRGEIIERFESIVKEAFQRIITDASVKSQPLSTWLL